IWQHLLENTPADLAVTARASRRARVRGGDLYGPSSRLLRPAALAVRIGDADTAEQATLRSAIASNTSSPHTATVAADAPRSAVHWEGDPGDRQTVTYGELEREVALMTSVLHDFGVEPDDKVALYTGWLPETVVTLLACIGLGARWSIVPISVDSEALAERLT